MPLTDNALLVWLVGLGVSPETEIALVRLLDAAERAHADRFVFPRHRRRFIARRAARRMILGEFLGMTPEAVPLHASEWGKPFTTGPVSFSASHSGEVAAVALARGGSLGIDLEWPDPDHADLAALAPFVDEATLARLASLRGDQRTAAFFRCWTRVEALAKATGTGIAHWPAGRFPASAERDGYADWPLAGEMRHRWHLHTWIADTGHVVSVATGRIPAAGPEIRSVIATLGPKGTPVLAPMPVGRTRDAALQVACS